jgi:hypothetical protein
LDIKLFFSSNTQDSHFLDSVDHIICLWCLQLDEPALPRTHAKTATVTKPSSKDDFVSKTQKVTSIYKGDTIFDCKTVLRFLSPKNSFCLAFIIQ